MQQHRADAETTSDGAHVLSSRSAETHQGVATGIHSPTHGDLLYGLGHAGVGDLDEARRDLISGERVTRGSECLLERSKGSDYRLPVQRKGEALGPDASQEEVYIGERQLPGIAASVAEGSRLGPPVDLSLVLVSTNALL